jgi:hypothetical protein
LQTGVERKATCRALFSKLLYLAESEELLPGADAEARRSLVADVFGATDDDAAQLRIVSLYEVRVVARQRILRRTNGSWQGLVVSSGAMDPDIDTSLQGLERMHAARCLPLVRRVTGARTVQRPLS